MDPNEYPRPDAYVGGIYPKDKTWGIVIIVLSALGLCGSLMVGAGGAVLGAAGATGAVNATADGRAAAAGVGAAGGLLAILGFVLAAFCVAQLVGGIGIMKSARWGFLITGGFAALNILLSLFRLPTSILGILISGVILYYCYSRISGKEGPTPV